MAVPIPSLTSQSSSSAAQNTGAFSTGPKTIAPPSGVADVLQQVLVGVLVAVIITMLLKRRSA
ncbi:MAG: hypothetical protein Q8Q73_14775 [Stagnimonas sp.]|nr:hypothetical protein [Stagnimonas sp.]